MHRDRLLLAIAALERVHEAALPFSMERWFNNIYRSMDCSTAACALGWICREPWAQELGLTTEQHGLGLYPTYQGHAGAGAAAALFDIDSNDAAWLFHPDHYHLPEPITALDVAERIRQLIQEPAL